MHSGGNEMSQRFEGRNLDEALQHAVETLGVDRWQLTYHVVLEKRGFLGGMKRIVIEAEVNREAAPPAEPPSAPQPSGVSRARGDRGERGGRRGGEKRGGAGRERERGRGRRGGDERRGGDRERRERGRPQSMNPRDFETFLGDVPAQGAESDAARAVREWCETLIRVARFDLVVRTEESDDRITVRLYGDDGSLLVDRHGELLDAIQVIVNKALVGRGTEKDIELNCEQFKERRIEDLERRARELADRVRRDGGEQILPAMTPIERRIIHLALHDDAEVTTESRGEGFYKRVAIIPRSAAVGAEPPSEP